MLDYRCADEAIQSGVEACLVVPGQSGVALIGQLRLYGG
jgi:hypothetical protein